MTILYAQVECEPLDYPFVCNVTSLTEDAVHGVRVGKVVDGDFIGRKLRLPACNTPAAMTPAPGIGLHYVAPEMEFRSCRSYNAFCEEAAYVASV
jgi:hypothetical protein